MKKQIILIIGTLMSAGAVFAAQERQPKIRTGNANRPGLTGRLERAEMASAPALIQRGQTEQPKVMRSLQSQLQEELSERWVYDSNNKVILDKIGKLIDAGLHPNNPLLPSEQTPLNFAFGVFPIMNPNVVVNRIPLIELLLSKGADINGRTPYGATPLMLAAMKDERAVDFLLNHGADVTLTDRDKNNALHCAAETLNPDTLKLLINYVQKIHREDLIDAQNDKGNTPLMEAIRSFGDYPVSQIPAFNVAQGEKCLAIVKLLIDAGANPTLENKDGRKAAMQAFWGFNNNYKKTEQELDIIGLLGKYTDSWKKTRQIKTPEKIGETHLPAGKKAFTEEAPLGGHPAHIVRQYLLGETEEERERAKAEANKGAETEEEEGD